MNAIREFFKGFQGWDFFVIFIVADLSQPFILGILFGTATWWNLIWFGVALMLWWLHIRTVKWEISQGIR